MKWWSEHKLPMEVYWMDIGWERDPVGAEAKDHLAMCVVDEKKHPAGLRPISDEAHKQGLKYLLWFGSARLWPPVERVRQNRPELLSAEYPGTDSGNPSINKYMILAQNPHLFIDNCCAGGENIDLETIKRSIALWRSDYQVNQNFDPIGMQAQTYSLSSWIPLSAGVSVRHS
jgi:alpha-galactosidase